MAVEAQLYLLYPVLLFLVGRYGWRRTMLILAVLETTIRGVQGLMNTLALTDTVGGWTAWTFTISPLGYWFSWSLGAYIAEACLKKEPPPFLRSNLFFWSLLAVACYFIQPLAGFRFMLIAYLTAMITSRLLVREQSPARPASRLLQMLKMTGLWSYSLYLLHQPLLVIYYRVINWVFPDTTRSAPVIFALVVVTWLVIIPFSILWYKVFEIPGIALGKKVIQLLDSRREKKSGREDIHAGRKTAVFNAAFWPMACGLSLLLAGSLVAGFKLFAADPVAGNNLAWRLATDPDPKFRNGARAVQLAEDACRETQCREIIPIGTLAAAYAEAGRFDDAVWASQKACELAAHNGETNLLQHNLELMKLYQNHEPYRDHPAQAGN